MKQRALAFLVFGVAVALGVAGCGGGGGGSNPNTTISVVIYPGTASIPVSGVINFTAVVYNFTSNSAVTWTSSAGSFTAACLRRRARRETSLSPLRRRRINRNPLPLR